MIWLFKIENKILKKIYCHVREKIIEEFVTLINKYIVKLICKILKFYISTYYKTLIRVQRFKKSPKSISY